MSDTTRLGAQSGLAKSDDVNRLRAVMQMNIAKASAGQIGVRGSHGSVFRQSQGFTTKGYSGAASTGVKPPWFLTGQIESGPVSKIYVKPGMVNNFVPTIGGTSLVAVPAPGLTVTGASGLIQLKATVDSGGTITALIVENVAGPSVTADTLTLKYKLVGTWTASGGAFTSVTSILNTNQTFRVCGGVAEWY